MDWTLPVDALVRMPHAALLVDADGRVRLCNRPAARLLRCDPTHVVGVPCWAVAGFSRPDGGPFCAPACPIHEEVENGATPPTCRLKLDGGKREIDLFTALIPPRRKGRFGVLHLLSPSTAKGCAARLDRAAVPRSGAPSSPMDALSPREREVLQLLATGMDTWALSRSLNISPTTARNHIQSILRTLGVHSRLEAVLIWLRRGR